MKEQLKQVITQLQNDPMSAIKVESIGYGNCVAIITNATNKQLIEQFGGAKEFFESLFAQGIKKIRITMRKQNGTAKAGAKTNYKNSTTIPAFEFEFEPKPGSEQPAMQNHSIPSFPLNGNQGLGYADIHKVVHYDTLKSELLETKAELKSTKEQLEKVKEDNLRTEILGVKKVETAEANGKLLQSAGPIIGLIQAMITKGQAAEIPGLAGTLSPTKQAFLQADDSLLQDLLLVSKGFELPGFEDKLEALLKEFNLIQVENAV